MTAPPRAPGELAEIEAIIRRNIVLRHMGPDSFMEGFEEAAAEIASLRSATRDGGEAMRSAAQNTALRVGRELGEPSVGYRIANAILALPAPALQPRSTKIEGAGEL